MQVLVSKITPVYPTSVHIQWDVTPDPGVSGAYVFTVEKSGSPGGSWVDTSGPLQDTIFYTDDLTSNANNTQQVNILPLNRELYYRVKCIAPNSVVDYSSPVSLDGVASIDVSTGVQRMGTLVTDPEQIQRSPHIGVATRPSMDTRKRLLRRKILRDQYISLRHLSGISVKILKRKHFGVRCTVCSDPLTEHVLVTKCATCYGTGWVGGFYTPIPAFAKIAPAATAEDSSEVGNTTLRRSTLQFIAYPKLEKGDIIVEDSLQSRWLVDQVNPLEVHRTTVLQMAAINELARSSVEYCVPVV